MRIERFSNPVTDAIRRDPPGKRGHEYEDDDGGKKEDCKQNADVAHKFRGRKPERKHGVSATVCHIGKQSVSCCRE